MKKKFLSKVVKILVIMGIFLQAFPGPAYAASNQPDSDEIDIILSGKIPPLPNREAVEKLADQVSKLIILGEDGKVSLRNVQVGTLKSGQLRLLKKFVGDINTGKIGIAIVTEDGVMVYGNKLALGEDKDIDSISSTSSIRVNRWGVHIYLNAYWTKKLTELTGWAIGIIVGLIVSALCPTGLGCILVGIVVSYIWEFVIWRTLRRYFPTSLTLHFRKPVWINGHLVIKRYVQPWHKDKWYNGRWFYRGRFHLI